MKEHKRERRIKISPFERNLKKIVQIKPSTDGRGDYFLYCTYHHHPGIVGEERAKQCWLNDCDYFEVYRK